MSTDLYESRRQVVMLGDSVRVMFVFVYIVYVFVHPWESFVCACM